VTKIKEFYLFLLNTEQNDSATLDHSKFRVGYLGRAYRLRLGPKEQVLGVGINQTLDERSEYYGELEK